MELLPQPASLRPLVRSRYLHVLRRISVDAALIAAFAFACVAVSGRSIGPQRPPDDIGASEPNPAAESQQIEAHRLGSREHAPGLDLNLFNQNRRKAIANDSEKLLALTAALKTELESDPSNVKSVDVVRKVNEIEKLAHKVKGRMLEDPTPSRLWR